MTAPIPFRVTRYRCPHCRRTHASNSRAATHIARCWHNPDVRGCKTCQHFDGTGEGYGEFCEAGVDLTGRPACLACDGSGWTGIAEGPARRYTPETTTCHVGDGREVRPGPITGCPQWEPAEGGDQ